MKLRDTLEKIIDKQQEISITLVRLTDSVEHHVKRSDLMEERVDLMAADIQRQLEPIKAHVYNVQGFAKILKWALAVIAGIIGVIGAILRMIR